MSRINSNLIYIWNAFRNLNVSKADKETTPEVTPEVAPVVAPEVTPEVAPSDEVELGASQKSWPCGSMGEYKKLSENEYCFNFEVNVESAEFGSFNVAQKHNNTTVHMLILDGEWLKNNLSSTFHISNSQGKKLWIQWPYSRDGLLDVGDATASVHNAYYKNLTAIHDAAVTIVAYDTGNNKSKVRTTALAKYQNQFWDHKLGLQYESWEFL